MDQPVIPFDLMRMFFGDAPPLFYLEILFRTVFIYIYTLAMLRWIGGRSVAQLSLVEFLLVIALGSSVGDALFYPEVPLLHAMAAITVVVAINKLIDRWVTRSERVTRIVDGEPVLLIERGRLVHDALGRGSLGVGELTAILRTQGIRNLGQIDSAYLEPAGGISVFAAAKPRPGLAIVPPPNLTPGPTPADPATTPQVCCRNCGAVHAGSALSEDLACPACGAGDWTLPT